MSREDATAELGCGGTARTDFAGGRLVGVADTAAQSDVPGSFVPRVLSPMPVPCRVRVFRLASPRMSPLRPHADAQAALPPALPALAHRPHSGYRPPDLVVGRLKFPLATQHPSYP